MTWKTNATDLFWGMPLGVVEVRTHSPDKCEGRNCVVHNPSDHHMKDWPTNWRSDTGVTERTCPHGVGHPDPDCVEYEKSRGNDWVAVHGCDGCCTKL